jgi:nicotinamidase/pyrazinamidase
VKALVIVDLQNDFCPGGALATSRGDEVVEVANTWMDQFDIVAATQDWHPEDHGSFADQHEGKEPGDVIKLDGVRQILWPRHCVQETYGAQFVPGLITEEFDSIFKKGIDPKVDSYSGFFDNDRRHSTGLHEWLQAKGVSDVYILGLATDYCVKYTVLDALELGYRTFVVAEGCRAVNLDAGDGEEAFNEMKEAGAVIIPDRSDRT